MATLREYVWHALKLVTLAVLSVLIWAAPTWVVAQLVRLGVSPAPAAWEVGLEEGAVVVLLVSFLVYVLESELKLHLYNARQLVALYRALHKQATKSTSVRTPSPEPRKTEGAER